MSRCSAVAWAEGRSQPCEWKAQMLPSWQWCSPHVNLSVCSYHVYAWFSCENVLRLTGRHWGVPFFALYAKAVFFFFGWCSQRKISFLKKKKKKKLRRKVKNKPGAFEYRFGHRDINYHGNGFCSSEGNVKHQIGSKYSVFFKVCFLLGG